MLETPPAADTLRPEIPKGLAEGVARCLEKDPAARFQNVAALARALQPFGTAASTPIVERIARIGVPVSGYAETINASAAELASAAATQGGPGTQGTWEKSGKPGARRTALFVAAGVGGALLVALGAFYAGRSGSPPNAGAAPEAERSVRASSAPAAPAATASAEAPVAPAVAPSAVEPAPAPEASVAAPADSAAKKTKAPATGPARPRCPAGQALSKGHCCPTGLVWLNGRCDRPLATLP